MRYAPEIYSLYFFFLYSFVRCFLFLYTFWCFLKCLLSLWTAVTEEQARGSSKQMPSKKKTKGFPCCMCRWLYCHCYCCVWQKKANVLKDGNKRLMIAFLEVEEKKWILFNGMAQIALVWSSVFLFFSFS